ncbi:RHS repeat-associated core domain-containing protein [Streptomyces graminilatus]|uniref:RHS repeat-associated core domain-containing protein n=1 Tax=Streptomyces graminilatus TaxID=1464070 RepID=UPI0006E46106|nr:RHS repeat-associated core domain-containing protein [Streptomyces graminilatus]
MAYQAYADAFDSEKLPSGEYSAVAYGRSPKQTVTVFDGAGRASTSTFYAFGVEKWSTSTTYTGDSTATTAPVGGSAARTIVDALGRTTETREYEGTSPADTGFGATVGATHTSTKFTYTRDGKQSTITGPDSKWSYLYDLYGRQTSATDPDMGTTTTGYTALDQVSWTKDAAGRVVISDYDVLGRATGTWSAPATADLSSTAEEKVDANRLTAYTYDGVTNAKGQRNSATRYVGGVAGSKYTKSVTAFDSLYRATSSTLQLPGGDALVTKKAVASTLTSTANYNIDGTLQYATEPAAGGFGSELVDYEYDGLGLNTRTKGTSVYMLDASYTSLSQPQVLSLGKSEAEGTYNAYISNQYETGTDRLLKATVTDDTHAYALQQLNYTYDVAGNVTSVSDPMTLGGTGVADNQCFTYDGHRRLTDAWTPSAADCSTANRTTAKLGGAAPYWTSYTYKDSGLRATEVTKTSGTPTTKTYCYDSTKTHRLLATTANNCTGVTSTYAYDATGNTTTRLDGTASQTLAWSQEGRLDTLKEGTSTTGYVYDADGSLLIRRNAAGETVLYLGGTEVHLDTSTSTAKFWAQRYYTGAGSTIAMRTNKSGTDKLTWLAGDHHGTSSLAIDNATQGITKRYSTPFGADRGKPTFGPWPDDKGFLGASADSGTGLTHLGAREYEPSTGRFISVDPLLNVAEHQSLNGYTYANNSPVTLSDPDGLDPCGGLQCGHEGDDCSDAGIYCYGSKPDGTADTSGVVPSGGGGTASASSTGNTGSNGVGVRKEGEPLWGALGDVVDTVDNYVTAVVTQPDIWWGAAETAGSVILMGAGGDLALAGGAVCIATLIGCVIGVPAAVGGVALVGVGAYGASEGIGRMSSGMNKALSEAESKSSSGTGSSQGLDSTALGGARETRVAELTGGKLPSGAPGKPGLLIKQPNVGTTDVDVIAADGTYIAVGGKAKARNLAALGQKLRILRWGAEQQGVGAKAYFQEGTPDTALNLARKVLGEDNVHTFNLG